MKFFDPIADGSVLMKDRGAYFPADLFSYDGSLFARHGRNFVRLLPSGSTSMTRLNWADIVFSTPGKTYEIVSGRLVIVEPPLSQQAA